MTEKFFIKNENLINLITKLNTIYNVYLPKLKEKKLHFTKLEDKFSNKNLLSISLHRTFEPIKAFFFKAREIVAEDFNDDILKAEGKPYCIVGVKACDLKGFLVQDHVFLNNDYKDLTYTYNRENNLIISTDCTEILDTCFCLSMDQKPYPEKDFDINLSPIEGGYIVEIGSVKGKNIINNYSSLFESSGSEQITEQEKNRKSIIKKVEKNIEKYEIPHQSNFPGIIEKNYEANIWKDEASTCVECGACNTICPTCHCFLLYDQKNEQKMARLRIWDSCLIKDFALIAAGANPRPFLWMRLRNRFEKKFDYFPKIADFYACTGCGRCISACPGKIDIRRILKRLVDNVQK